MTDSRKVLGVLQDARELVRDDWGSSNADIPWKDAHGGSCASVAITAAFALFDERVQLAAHVAFLRGAGVKVPSDEDAIYGAVYAFNDSQASKRPVVAAFDKAIATIEAELAEHQPFATPNADAALRVMVACEQTGEVVARQIVAAHPQMDLREVAQVASAELFYAAQDTAQACAVGTKLARA